MVTTEQVSLLQKFDLSEHEIKLYLSLLKMGKSTVLNLSRYTGIKRSSVHHYTDQLISKGLIVQTNNEGRRLLLPESPAKLKMLLEAKKDEVAILEEKLPQILTGLTKLIKNESEGSDVSVLFYSGKKAIEDIYNEVLKHNEIYTLVNLEKSRSLFPENRAKFKKAIENQTTIHSIIKGTKESLGIPEYNDSTQIKYVMNKDYQMDLDIMIYPNHAVFINFNEIKPTAIVIEGVAIYEGLKAIFNLMWSILPEK